jgi:hypothetical protein
VVGEDLPGVVDGVRLVVVHPPQPALGEVVDELQHGLLVLVGGGPPPVAAHDQ